MKKKVKAWFISFLKLLFAGALIAWLLHGDRFDFRRLAIIFQPQILMGAFSLILLNTIVASERWRGLLLARGFHLSFLQAMRFTLIGSFFNFVIPGGVGGDVVKSYYVAKENPTARLKSILTIAMDRLLGLFSMLVMALIVMLIEWETVSNQIQLRSIFKFLSVIFLGFAFAWAFIFSRRLYELGLLQKILMKLPKSHYFLNLYTNFSDYRHHKSLFFKSVILSFLAQIISVLFFVYMGSCFGFSDIRWTTYFFVVPIGFMITAIPISPAGLGVGQMAFFFLFNLVLGQESQVGPLAISAFQIYTFFIGIIGAIIYVASGKRPQIAEV